MTDQSCQDSIIKDILQWDGHIHAFVELSETETTLPDPGQLGGLTVGIKDIIDVKGLPTRNGSDACHDAVPATEDAQVVTALRAAGARIVGKTTTTEFAFTDPTVCRNPHDLSRTPGGSSSGSGAAVAAGVVDIALGTQTAGSLCRPAAYCGVVGFKPTYGVLPTRGVTPLAPSFDSVGIIAGTVTLAQKAFDAMAPCDGATSHAMAPATLCGLWDNDVIVNADTRDALNDAATVLAGLGVCVADSPLIADVDRIVAAHRAIMHFEASAFHGSMLNDARISQLKPKFRKALEAGAAITPAEAAEAAAFLAQANQDFWQSLADVDIVLTLPVPDGPPMIDGTTGFQDWLTPWTVFGGPLICLPWGADSLGRPRSVMLAAHPGKDAELLVTAATLERHCPPLSKPQLPDA